MFAVIFEVQPRAERWDDYLATAGMLRPEIVQIDGFIDNERFRSRKVEGRLLSLSTWRDEKSVIRWRTLAAHHQAQKKGRTAVFQDYHLRVGEVTADNQVPPGHSVQQQRLDETETGAAKYATITELPAVHGKPAADDPAAALGLPAIGSLGLVDADVFDSITDAGKCLMLASWCDAEAAATWRPVSRPGARHRQVRIVRDYGMFDRREAPQFYPPVSR